MNRVTEVGGLSANARNAFNSFVGRVQVFFSKGPTQKSSKYGIGPSQQDKIAKYTKTRLKPALLWEVEFLREGSFE